MYKTNKDPCLLIFTGPNILIITGLKLHTYGRFRLILIRYGVSFFFPYFLVNKLDLHRVPPPTTTAQRQATKDRPTYFLFFTPTIVTTIKGWFKLFMEVV